MSMNFVDIASYQATLDLNNINYDGVAIKATEGTGYVNPDCDMHYQEAKAAGKKRAVYHFFDFGVDAIAAISVRQYSYLTGRVPASLTSAKLLLS
jgi:GH25 family lysozyme M1 (1,4-beta-N-acetylmuramidase)